MSRTSVLTDLRSEPDNEYCAQGRELSIYLWEGGVHVCIQGLMVFSINVAESVIECVALAHVKDALIRYWMLQQILPMFLLFEGSTELLHGAAVTIGKRAIVFLGQSGVGKSTLINYFLSRNSRLITDEHVAISRFSYETITPSTPFYRPYRSLEDLGLTAFPFSVEPVPISMIYILQPVLDSAAIAARQIPTEALVSEVFRNQQYNVYNPRIKSLFPLVARRFSGMSHLVRTVPIRYLEVPRSLSRLPDVYDFVLGDVGRVLHD